MIKTNAKNSVVEQIIGLWLAHKISNSDNAKNRHTVDSFNNLINQSYEIKD